MFPMQGHELGLVPVGSWTPSRLQGLIGWYKADAGVYRDAGVTLATNGQTVQQWNDQSGNGNNLSQATVALRPTWNTNIQNSLPGVVFVSSGPNWLRTATLNLGGLTASMFGVIKGSAPAPGARGLGFTANGQAQDFDNAGSAVFLYYPANSTASAFRNSVQLSNGTITNAAFTQIGSIYDGVNNTEYIAGTAQTAAANSNTFAATGVFTVAADGAGASNFDGTLLEMIITSTAISASDRANIKSYFTNKWAV